MIDILVGIGISNAIVSLVIAVVAIVVGKCTKKPRLAHLLWLLVLVKLLMPSLLTLPILTKQNLPTNSVSTTIATVDTQSAKTALSSIITPQTTKSSSSLFPNISLSGIAKTYLPTIWGLGIIMVLAWSLIRIFRFNRLLNLSSEIAPQKIYEVAEEIADTLKLGKLPLIKTTTAEISPMVWWVGGKVHIFIPSVLIETLESEKLRLVIAHELAHIKRRDYIVRWVEWTATVLFWWNPVVWWAQHNLRANEEMCCDALILSSLKPKPSLYAESLLHAVENFAGSAFRPPSMASEVNSGGHLLRRINMILSNENNRAFSGKMQILVLFAAALILPLGLINAQDKDVDKNLDALKKAQTQISAALKAGKIPPKEAKMKMAEIKQQIKFHHLAEKLKFAVKSGKISSKKAEYKLKLLKRRYKIQQNKTDDLKQAAEELEKARMAGKISEKEARSRLAELKQQYVQAKRHEELRRVEEKLRYAVETNRLSAKKAEVQLYELQRRQAVMSKTSEFKRKAEALQLAVKRKELSAMDAEARMLALKQSYTLVRRNTNLERAAEKLEWAVKNNRVSAAEAEKQLKYLRQKQVYAERNLRLKEAAKNLQMAVKAGKISEKEAAVEIENLKRSYLAAQKLNRLKQAEEKIRWAVKAGKISEKDAEKQLKALMKGMKKQNN